MSKKQKKFNEDYYNPAKEAFTPDFYGNDWNGWGVVIRQLRDFTGMDQTVFGRLIGGYTRAQISRYETEASEPPVDFWAKMARAFGLNITWAITGQGPTYINGFGESEERKRYLKWTHLVSEKEGFLDMLHGK